MWTFQLAVELIFGATKFFVRHAQAVAGAIFLILGGTVVAAICAPLPIIEYERRKNKATDLDGIKSRDPDFSQVLFEDFVYRLFAKAHLCRAFEAKLATLAPYMDDEATAALVSMAHAEGAVSSAVIGSLRVENLIQDGKCVTLTAAKQKVTLGEDTTTVVLHFDANLQLNTAEGQVALFVTEQWTFERSATARTKRPQGVERLGCPHCGAPFSSSDGAQCESCQQVVSHGRFDWCVVDVQRLRTERLDEDAAAEGHEHVEEVGTDYPTIRDKSLPQDWSALQQRDNALTAESFMGRLSEVFIVLNEAWAKGDLGEADRFLSEGMQDYLRFGLARDAAAGRRNLVKDVELLQARCCRVHSDKHFDAITVRLWARSVDCTRSLATGKVVSGDPDRPRLYSEYWTLVRGVQVATAAEIPKACPSCSAPLADGMADRCLYCNTFVTSADFDWVLSRIEQDDSYEGGYTS